MFYVRGFPFDFDRWADMGNPTWDWEHALQYFKKSEGMKNPEFVNNNNGKYHSDKGLLAVDLHSDLIPASYIHINASMEKLGVGLIDDINADKYIGYLNGQATATEGRRQSTAKAFLSSAMDRSNLHIVKHAHVQKIHFNNKKEATGVEFIYKGQHTFVANAAKEVILSAGAVSSPQILMLSGIGPENELKKHEIPVQYNNAAVGQNLLDHVLVPLYFGFHRSAPQPMPPKEIFDAIYNLAMHNTGLLTSIAPANLIAFLDSKNVSNTPDYQMHFLYLPQSSFPTQTYLGMMNYEQPIAQALLEQNAATDIGVIWLILLRPKSKGFIELKSNEANDHPRIVPNYFDDEDDMATMIRAIRQQVSFMDTDTYRSHEAELIRLPLPNCDHLEFESDAYWACYTRHFSTTLYHPVGTSKMGPDDDHESVVDWRLKVKGVKRLRQIDAGISRYQYFIINRFGFFFNANTSIVLCIYTFFRYSAISS